MADGMIDKLVVIISSTGGPNALHKLIPMLDKNLDAPVVVVQHMPEGFTPSLAERLDDLSEISVSEVVDGEILNKGHVYLAKGGRHLEFAENMHKQLFFRENKKEAVHGLRPCANITLQSLISVTIDSIICVVLTGMGTDGCEGIKSLRKKQNIYTITQNEETCVIYGMPKAVVESGMADRVLPLDEIAQAVINNVGVR